MKHIYNYSIALIFTMCLCSCELTEIDEIQPNFIINTGSAFSSPKNAEQALVGVYNKTLLNQGTWLWNAADHGKMGIEIASAFGSSPTDLNSLHPETGTLTSYSLPYEAINAINHLIAGVPTIDDDLFDGNRKAEILGEAHLLRAFLFFNLLRSYGQFWDRNSEYGIVVHTEPNESLIIKPRSTVQESYDQIVSDLNFAIANAPTFSTAIYASKEAAQAIKARILLQYGGSAAYTEAATLCEVVINSGNFSWEASYGDIFTNNYNSSEAILVNYWDHTENSNGNIKPIFFSFLYTVNPVYDALMPANDPRREFAIAPGLLPFLPKSVAKYTDDSSIGLSATFYMRLAEVYLIQAECLVRSNAPLADAQAALDAVRGRVGLLGTAAPDADQLLADIRTEKLLDLAFEDAQPWFDMIRYHVLGDINISTIKPTIDVATNGFNQFILPIPPASLRLSEGLVLQNPGYPVED